MNKRILIIHNDRSFAKELSEECARAHYDVTTAFDSVQGIGLIRTSAPDLVAAAVTMPGGGAANVYDFLKLTGRVTAKVVFLSDEARPSAKPRQPDAVLWRGEGAAQLVARFGELLAPAKQAAPIAQRTIDVLVIEDQVEHCELIRHCLRDGERFTVTCAQTVADACEQLRSRPFSCVLLDHNLPDGKGTDVLDRAGDVLLATPVIGISTSRDPEIAIADFRGGCIDFVAKYEAFKEDVLKSRIEEAIAQFDRRALAISMQRTQLIKGAQRSLDDLMADARLDPLMGIWSRRALNEYLPDLHSRAVEGRFPYAIAMLDLDNFKALNDQHGHAAGDQALRAIGPALLDGMRGDEFIARFGGEEIAVLLERTDLEQARLIAERLRERIFNLAIPNRGSEFGRVTASVGVAALAPGSNLTQQQVIDLADAALYRAKRQGRNAVVAEVGGARAA